MRRIVLSEQSEATEYKVFPTPGTVLGFQYRGQLSVGMGSNEVRLSAAGISGLMDRFRVFRASAGIGTVLVYFQGAGLAAFTSCPVHELFGLSIGLEQLFPTPAIRKTEEQLSAASTDRQRIALVERFLLDHLDPVQEDGLVREALRRIGARQGHIRMSELQRELYTSASPLEKRFRALVGTTPKKWASIVRFQSVWQQLEKGGSLTEIGYESGFFDQAHFIHSFRQFTGESPDRFRRQEGG